MSADKPKTLTEFALDTLQWKADHHGGYLVSINPNDLRSLIAEVRESRADRDSTIPCKTPPPAPHSRNDDGPLRK